MIFTKTKPSQNLSKAEQKRAKRLKRTMTPSTQNTLNYKYLMSDGLMKVTDDSYSKTYRLGDISYITATDEERLAVVETAADVFNSLDSDNNLQLLLINRRLEATSLSNFHYDLQEDSDDDYREEYNAIIDDHFEETEETFKVEKYVTLTTQADNDSQARRILDDTATNIDNQYSGLGIPFKPLDGLSRLLVFQKLLQNEDFLDFDYEDIAISGLTTRDFIAPNSISFKRDYALIDDKPTCILYAKQFPTRLGDKLLKNILDTGIELAISLHAKPYDSSVALKKVRTVRSSVRREMIKSQKTAFKAGIAGDLVVGGVAQETNKETEKWQEELQENDQKMFSGLIAVYLQADSLDQLNHYIERVNRSVRKNGVELSRLFLYQEEALNTVLPIGFPFVNVKRRFMRDLTTANLATQVPFTSVDLRSKSPNARYYGQNQLSKNPITLDRKNDLNTGSGCIFGTSGSGKSMFAKAGEIIPTLLRYTNDRVIIVDPEAEYLDIGQAFGAEVITVAPGSPNHFNLLDLPDQDKLQAGEDDPIGQKSNLLSTLFENIFSSISDKEFAMIDRVTHLCYERIPDRMPTLKDWHAILDRKSVV